MPDSNPSPSLNSVEAALGQLREGRMVVVMDNEARGRAGFLVAAGESATPEMVNFMASQGRGLVYLALPGARLDELQIPLMPARNRRQPGPALCVSIEARKGVSTGISAADRAATIRTASDPASQSEDLVRPGHVFPLRAVSGGVLKRVGTTEAALDLVQMAGKTPAAAICEILDDLGVPATGRKLAAFAKSHKLRLVRILDLIRYRMARERLVQRAVTTRIPTRWGEFQLIGYQSILDDKLHLLLRLGDFEPEDDVLVRVHSECLTGDVFGSLRCDCGLQLDKAMQMISKEGKGVVLYLRQEGRGIGLLNKLKAYEIQDEEGKDTVDANLQLGFEADQREYGIGAQMLVDQGLRRIRVLTNNPKKYAGIRGYGLEIVERIPIETPVGSSNRDYLKTKKQKLGHLLSEV